MDGKDRYFDNIIEERFWLTIKYELVYFEFRTITALRAAIADYITFYNTKWMHQSLKYKNPVRYIVYQNKPRGRRNVDGTSYPTLASRIRRAWDGAHSRRAAIRG